MCFCLRECRHFLHQFVTSPLCCPSRSSILTGRYVHNHLARNNSITGNCSSSDWQKGPEQHTFNNYVKKNGYRTFYGGKYLNQYGTKKAGGPEHIPPGWDAWYGLVGNSRYYNYTLSINGVPQQHHADYKEDYLTDVLVCHYAGCRGTPAIGFWGHKIWCFCQIRIWTNKGRIEWNLGSCLWTVVMISH